MALELLHHELQLPGEFLLLLCVWRAEGHRGHILYKKKAQFIARAVEESVFDFDLVVNSSLYPRKRVRDVHVCAAY